MLPDVHLILPTHIVPTLILPTHIVVSVLGASCLPVGFRGSQIWVENPEDQVSHKLQYSQKTFFYIKMVSFSPQVLSLPFLET